MAAFLSAVMALGGNVTAFADASQKLSCVAVKIGTETPEPEETEENSAETATDSTAHKATESEATEIPKDEQETFEVSYYTDPEEGAAVRGDKKVKTGETLRFSVSVKKGYELNEVNVSGDVLVPVSENGTKYSYEVEDILFAPEVNVILSEVEYPAFEISEDFGEVTVTVSADEGILPAGTYAEIEEVEASELLSELAADADESEAEQKAYFFDITLYDEEGNELSADDWNNKKGGVEVSFTGSGIDEAKESSKDAKIVHVDEEGEEDVVKTVKMNASERNEDGISFKAKHFSVYGVMFTPFVVAEGDGFTWEPETKTLTVTNGTEGSATTRPYSNYKTQAEHLIVDVGDKEIGTNAFQSFSKVQDVTVKSCGDIQTKAFSSLSKVETIVVEKSGNLETQAFYFTTIAGGSTPDVTIKIKECGNIAEKAINPANQIKEITIGTCSDIEKYGFNGFSYLEKLSIDNAGKIGNRAFGSLSRVEEVTIGTCGGLDAYVFQNTGDSTTAPKLSIAKCGAIPTDAFNSAKFVEVEIGECEDIGEDAFSSNSKLATLKIGKCGNIGDDAFGYCSALTEITLNCGNIGKTIFRSCPNIKTMTIEKCGDIASQAFLGMKGLETVTIKECGAIGSSAFGAFFSATGSEPCESLKEVVINKCDSIGSNAFNKLSALEKIEIKDCAVIGANSFWAAGAPVKELILENCVIEENAFIYVGVDDLELINVEIGDNSFANAKIKSVTLLDIDKVGKGAFAGITELTDITIKNVNTIGENMFEIYPNQDGNNVTHLTLDNVNRIEAYAFKDFNNLETVTITETCGYIGAHAFTGCDKLKSIDITDKTRLGYSDSFVNLETDYVKNRVEKILKDQYTMIIDGKEVSLIAPDGWTSAKTGTENGTEIGDTQLTKEAKWSDNNKTKADVQIKAYYTAKQQMDFVIVADCSNSMSGFGSGSAMDSNFYNMQSKMMDTAEEILSSEDKLDARVAFVTFGEDDSAKSEFFEKGDAQAAKEYIWNDIVDYYSNTNYSSGLAPALELVQENKALGRNTTVIFISDGQPYYIEGQEIPESYYGVAEADAIKAEGAQIISVLQQVYPEDLAESRANMEKIADKVFASTDLDGFSEAINDAIDYAQTSYTLTDTINPEFTLDESSIEVSSGDYVIGTDADGNTTITWSLYGAPFEEHTLTFELDLKPTGENYYGGGTFDTNKGNATFNDGENDVNEVPTPQLTREADTRYGNLNIKKVVSGTTATTKFDFTAEFTDKAGNLLSGTYDYEMSDGSRGSVTITEGKINFRLGHDEWYQVNDLPEGTKYKVTEASNSLYTQTPENAEGTILGGGATYATYTNTRKSGGGSSGGSGGGGGGGGGTPGKPITPEVPQQEEGQEVQIDDTPGYIPPHPEYNDLPVMGDTQFGPGFVNTNQDQVKLDESKDIIPQLKELYAQNNELEGWITVVGTEFGYPVMYSPTNPTYYQHRTFNKNIDGIGVPFLAPYCNGQSMNVLIHGHNMRDVSQFGYIWNYQYPEFRAKNPTIDFKTLYDGNGQYDVMAVFFAPVYPEETTGVFKWYQYHGDMNKNQFDYYVQNVKALSLYDTGVTAEYGDQLITLETCASTTDSTRLVVVARKKGTIAANNAEVAAQIAYLAGQTAEQSAQAAQ